MVVNIQRIDIFPEEETDPEKSGVRAVCQVVLKDRFGKTHATKSYILLEPTDFFINPSPGEGVVLAERRMMRAIITLISDQVKLAMWEAKEISDNV